MSELWSNLRRRRVVSTAATYLAVAFVLLQLGEILFPAFDLGPGALRALFALLLAMFPVAVALSWVFDVTGAGVRRTDAVGEGVEGRPLFIATVVLSAVALGAVGWWAVRAVEGGATRSTGSSIAVLPFVDMSAEGDQAYLGDGLAEEILNVLAGVTGLQVAARTSSFAFRDNDDIRDIGDRLNVQNILEGSIRRDDEQVRITAQLIDTASGFHVWSATFDREVEDLFLVQDEIAQAIADALLGKLDLPVVSTRRHVPSAEAQDLYWRGRAQWSRRDALGIPGAIDLFTRAIQSDSLYAQAYAGLADSWALMPQYVLSVDAEGAMTRAEAFARRAIELDADLAEPHASLGLVRALRRDRVGALAAFGRAVELNASYAPALHWRANVLAEMGRFTDAADDAQRAASLDPLSAAIASDHGQILLWSGQPDAAMAEFTRAQSLDFGFAAAIFGAALVALEQGDEVTLQMSLARWSAVSNVPPTFARDVAPLALAYRRTGEPQPVPAVLSSAARGGRLPAGTLAALHALLGARDEALTWLQASLGDRSWVDQYLRVNPIFDGLRPEADFQRILAETAS